MTNLFFEKPILNSPYGYPGRYWELDETGQPTQQILKKRRPAEFITPISKPKMQKGAQQDVLLFDDTLSTQAQQYHTTIINSVRAEVLTPDLVGATETRNSGIIGETVDLNLVHTGDMRPSQVVYELTPHLLLSKWRDANGEPQSHLFGQLKRIARQWLDGYLVCKGGTYPAQLKYKMLADMACERIMGLEVPCRYGSGMRQYRPDFIVLVNDERGDDDLMHLVVEIKGYRREDAKEKKSTMDTHWVPGVNKLGTYGRWAFAEFTDVWQMQHDFAKMVKAAFERLVVDLLPQNAKQNPIGATSET